MFMIGMLYLLFVGDEGETEQTLFIPTGPATSGGLATPAQRIAQRHFKGCAEPFFGSGESELGGSVEYFQAADEELLEFLRHWARSVSIKKWLAKVKEKRLLPEEFDRLERVCNQVLEEFEADGKHHADE